MARIRSIKPEFLTDSKTGTLTDTAAKLFIGLLIHADDYGVLRFDIGEFKARIFPYAKGDPVTKPLTGELLPRGLVLYFTVDHVGYLHVAKFREHQRVDHPGKPLLPRWDEAPSVDEYAALMDDTSISSQNEPPFTDDSRTVAKDREPSRLIGGEGKGINTHVEQARPDDVETVWEAFRAHHPRAVLTTSGKNPRRPLIQRALDWGYPVDTLIAAIEGNHADPHCNGQNDRGREYHDLELILRDADHIETYAAIAAKATNGAGASAPVTEADIERAKELGWKAAV